MLKTKFGRAIGFGWLVAFVLDLALAYALATWLAANDFWLGFSAILAVLWLGPVVFAFKGMIYKIVLFYLTKGTTRRNLVQDFRRARLPLLSGTSFNDPADLYFQEVASDDSLPKSAVDYANATVGQLGLISRYSSVDAVICNANLDAALGTYFDEMRRDGVQPHGQ